MSVLTRFSYPFQAVVIGSSGGVGAALVKRLSEMPNCRRVFALSRYRKAYGVQNIVSLACDIEDETSINKAARELDQYAVRPIDLIIVATGRLHSRTSFPEKSWKDIQPEALEEIFRINTFGPALIGKHFLNKLNLETPSVFAALSARVGSIEDNGFGGWYSYRASKVALNMIMKNFAIEMRRKSPNPTIVGLHPGTVATNLSEPFQAKIPAEKLFTPEQSATYLLNVINKLKPDDSGLTLAYDGQIIPY